MSVNNKLIIQYIGLFVDNLKHKNRDKEVMILQTCRLMLVLTRNSKIWDQD